MVRAAQLTHPFLGHVIANAGQKLQLPNAFETWPGVQLLLVICGGSMTASMPFVAAMYATVLTAWSAAVVRLDKLHVCQFSRIGHIAQAAENNPARK